VYYSKDISKNLISGITLAESNIKCEVNNYLNKPQLIITHYNKTILKTYVNKYNNFCIKTKNSNLIINQNVYNMNNKHEHEKIWHNRLGHFSHNNLDKYLKSHNINKNECIECKISKLNRKPHNGITPNASRINEIIYSDIMGPISESINKYKYIITFLDDYSRKAWVYTLKNTSDAPKIINFIKLINNQFPDNKIKIFKSDNGKEYNNKKIINFCKRNGISKVFSPPYNPQNNSIAERFNRTISSCTKTMLYWAKLSQNFWEFAVKHATYIYNLVPHKSINNEIPNEIYYKKKVKLEYLKTFGCIAYYKNYNQNKPKFDINSKKGIYLGFDLKTYSYIIMDFYDQKLLYTREAIFLEGKPARLNLQSGTDSGNNVFSKINIPNGSMELDTDQESEGSEFDPSDYPISKIPDDHILDQEFESDPGNSSNKNSQENFNFISTPHQPHISYDNINTKRPISPYEDDNIKKLKTSNNNSNDLNYKNYDSKDLINKNPNFTNSFCYFSNNIKYKQIDIIQNDDGLYVPKIYILNTDVPISYKHIFFRKDKVQWLIAIQVELENLYKNNVMTFVKTIPKNANIISTQWVFAIKRDKLNEIIRYKARLVAHGDKQIYGVDYIIIYSPTLDMACIRLIIFFASKFKWNIFQLDIQAAYLNAPLNEDVYVKIPQGDKNFGKGFWKLKKSLYGLKQSGRNWNYTITKFLIKIGFIQCKSEPCLFFHTNENNQVSCIIGLYVDDFIITGQNYDLLYFIQ